MTALTRGPLPARVYWRRRLLLVLVVLVVLGVVVGTVRLLGLGSDASSDASSDGEPQATQVAAEQTSDAAEPTVTASDTPSESRGQQDRSGKKSEDSKSRGPVLAEPEGVCSDRDIAVTPSARKPVAGSPITFALKLRTIDTPACTWKVSPTTLTMKITSGSDDIWTSQDCPRAVPSEDVVVYDNKDTKVEVTWSGRRSDDECSKLTTWALPGWYHVDASALAGEPSDLHFELEKPEPGVVTKTVEPDPKKKKGSDDSGTEQQDGGQQRGGGQGRG